MDWITGIQRALDYIEAHLTDDIIMKPQRGRPPRRRFIFSGCSVCLLAIRWAIISVCAVCRLPPMSFTIQIKRSSILRCNTDTIRQKAFLALSHAFMASRQPKHAEAVISSPFPVFPLS